MSKRSIAVLTFGLLFAGCAASTTTAYKGRYPVMLGPKDRVRATAPLATNKLADYEAGTYRSSTHEANAGESSNGNLTSLDVEAERVIGGDPADDIRVNGIEAEAWATLLNSAASTSVVVRGNVVRTEVK
jgi:hypothetical protein